MVTFLYKVKFKYSTSTCHWIIVFYFLFYSKLVFTWSLKESYMAQNSLELKLPSTSSPGFYAKQRTLSPKEKMDIKVDYTELPAGPSLWQISRILCPRVKR